MPVSPQYKMCRTCNKPASTAIAVTATLGDHASKTRMASAIRTFIARLAPVPTDAATSMSRSDNSRTVATPGTTKRNKGIRTRRKGVSTSAIAITAPAAHASESAHVATLRIVSIHAPGCGFGSLIADTHGINRAAPPSMATPCPRTWFTGSRSPAVAESLTSGERSYTCGIPRTSPFRGTGQIASLADLSDSCGAGFERR